MVSSTRQAIACILVIFSTAVFVRAQTAQPKEPTSTITGKVTIKGKAAPGIFVGLRRQASEYARQLTGLRTVTDSEGKYRLENVTAGSYVVLLVAPAYITSDNEAERTLIVNKGETIENVDFELIRGGAITGRVVDADGRPVIEEDVMALPEAENNRGNMKFFGARTDDRGVYRIFALPPGRYKVAAGLETSHRFQSASYKRIYHPGVEDVAQAAVIDVSEGGETSNIDITLGRPITTYTASGRIIDGQTGQPRANVGYGLIRYFGNHGSSSMSSAVGSNSRGEFRLENLVPGKYGVSIQDRTNNEWRADVVVFDVVDQNVTGLVIKTQKGAVISGTIVVEGAEEKSAREELMKAYIGAAIATDNPYMGSSSSAMPARDGSFRITGLGSGTASFHVYSPTSKFRIIRVERNGVVQPNSIEIKPGEQLAGFRIFVNFGSAAIQGTIKVENGTVPPGANFYVYLRRLNDDSNAQGMGFDSNRQIDSRGQFLIEHLLPGTYELNVGLVAREGRSTLAHQKQEVVVTAGATTNVTITVDLSPKPTRP